MNLQWRQGDYVRVERRAPYMSPVGKIQHLHHQRQAATASS